jgi:hypothetical protein
VAHTYNGFSNFSNLLFISCFTIFSIVQAFIIPFNGNNERFFIENNQLSTYLLYISSAFHQLSQYAQVRAHALTQKTALIFFLRFNSSNAFNIQHAYIPLAPPHEIVNTNDSSFIFIFHI